MRSGCERFIGMRYRLGGDGSDGEIDCIHLTLQALEVMGIPHPPMNEGWYTARRLSIMRDLYGWGRRVERPTYDGDVVLIPQDSWAFAVTWQKGILYIHRAQERVLWSPLASAPSLIAFRCSRLSGS